MKEQILKIIEFEGLTPAKFADEIGVQRSSISHILSDRNKPSYDFIIKVLNRFSGLNAEWLITGKGNMIKNDQTTQKQSIQKDLFDKIDPYLKEKAVENTQNTTDNFDNRLIHKSSDSKSVINNITEFTNVNSVKFIVVFYQDGTFEKFASRD